MYLGDQILAINYLRIRNKLFIIAPLFQFYSIALLECVAYCKDSEVNLMIRTSNLVSVSLLVYSVTPTPPVSVTHKPEEDTFGVSVLTNPTAFVCLSQNLSSL